MNYHIIVDDKFIDDFIKLVDLQNNRFLIQKKNKQLKYIKSTAVEVYENLYEFWLKDINDQLQTVDKVFIHYYHPPLDNILKIIPNDVEVGVFFWGGEFTEGPEVCFMSNNYLPKTLKLFKKIFFYPNAKFNYINKKNLFFRIINKINFEIAKYKFLRVAKKEFTKKAKSLERVNYLYHWNRLDYEWIKKKYKNFNAGFRFFFYEVGLEKIKASKSEHTGYNIWIGNSATYSNNHLDAFDEIHNIEINKIICPLSYGQIYLANIIKVEGEKRFGNKFHGLTDFIQREEYYNLFSSIDFVIMNHKRTQAAGNIFMFIYNHIPVFMQPESTLYKLLKSLHIKNVFNINEINKLKLNEIISERFLNNDDEILLSYINKNKKDNLLKTYLS